MQRVKDGQRNSPVCRRKSRPWGQGARPRAEPQRDRHGLALSDSLPGPSARELDRGAFFVSTAQYRPDRRKRRSRTVLLNPNPPGTSGGKPARLLPRSPRPGPTRSRYSVRRRCGCSSIKSIQLAIAMNGQNAHETLATIPRFKFQEPDSHHGVRTKLAHPCA